jgi:hypothetical protein
MPVLVVPFISVSSIMALSKISKYNFAAAKRTSSAAQQHGRKDATTSEREP